MHAFIIATCSLIHRLMTLITYFEFLKNKSITFHPYHG